MGCTKEENNPRNCKLTIVIANPIQLTIVSAAAFDWGIALFATSVENIGESAITTNPQNNRKIKKSNGDSTLSIIGEMMQQMADNNKHINAIFFGLMLEDNIPLDTQAITPTPITKNE